MSFCNIYDNLFLDDLITYDKLTIDILAILSTLPSDYNSSNKKNVWFPLIINHSSLNGLSYQGNLLIRSQPNPKSDPCNCEPISSTKYDGDIYNNLINCGYCNTNSPSASEWELKKEGGETVRSFSSSCGSEPVTHKDIRANLDDLLYKIPCLNNSYINDETITDLKYYGHYPATQCDPQSNLCGIGFGQFITDDSSDNSKEFLSRPKFVIDWHMGAKMGEVPFDGKSTHHKDVNTHIQSYNRFLNTNKTCGNFIFLKPSLTDIPDLKKYGLSNVDDTTSKLKLNHLDIPYFSESPSALAVLPKLENYTIPYGLSQPTINNVFINKKKDLSHWLWHYEKAVLCWYRYAPLDPSTNAVDKRPIPDVDLYISDGDVLWAKNIGPETVDTKSDCPMGTKVVGQDNIIKYVIPNQSEFIYISANIYNKFLSILDRMERTMAGFIELPIIDRINIAAIEATGPSYDQVTLDLLKSIPKQSNPESVPSKIINYRKNRPHSIDLEYRSRLEENIQSAKRSAVPTDRTNFAYDDTNSDIPSARNKKNILDMVSKNDNNMTGILKDPNFRHQPSASKLNYIYDKTSLITTLAYKYGSYLYIPTNSIKDITLKQQHDPHYAYNIDFEIVTSFRIERGGRNRLCTDIDLKKIVGYDQNFNNGFCSTNLNSFSKMKVDCINGSIPRNNAVSANIGSAKLGSETITNRVLFSGGAKNFNEIYYRGSYVLANKILGDALCYKDHICTPELFRKYSGIIPPSVLPYVTVSNFENRDISLGNSYNGFVYNPNIDILGVYQSRGIYYESNIYGSGVRFAKNNISASSVPTLSFRTYNCGIKIYSLSIEKLRSAKNLACKTLPTKDKCKCYPIDNIPEYPLISTSCNNKPNLSSTLWTPSISTNNFTIMPYGGYDQSNEIYIDSSKPPNHPATIPKINFYQDPEMPGCNESFRVSLPVYTRTNWGLTTHNFNIGEHDLWATVSDTLSVLSDKNKIEVKINNLSVYQNQYKLIPQQKDLAVDMTNKKLEAIMNKGTAPILYIPLKCSTEDAAPSQKMQEVSIDFKHIAHKHKLYFKPSSMQKHGFLNTCSYTKSDGLKSGKYEDYYPFIFDSKMFTFGIEDRINNNSTRYYGSINNKLLQTLSLLKDIDRKKINLHLKLNNRWTTIKYNVFGYNNSHNNFIGYPLFYEYLSATTNKQLLGFLPSFRLVEPHLVVVPPWISTQKFSKVQYNEIYHNFVNLESTKDYFRVPRQDETYATQRNEHIANIIFRPIAHNMYYDNDNIRRVSNTTDTLIVREKCDFSVVLVNKNLQVTCIITDKYIFRSKKTGKYYTSFRLIPRDTFVSGLPLDYTNDISNSLDGWDIDWSKSGSSKSGFSIPLKISRNIFNIYNENDILLKKHKWADVYGYDKNYKTFDLTNRLMSLYDSPGLLYDHTMHNLWIFLHRFKQCHDYINIQMAGGLDHITQLAINKFFIKELYAYFYTDDNTHLVSAEKDYLYPFVDINLITETSFPNNSDTTSTIDFFVKNFKVIGPPVDTDLTANNFWIDIPHKGALYQQEIIDDFKSLTIKRQQPGYLLEKTSSVQGKQLPINFTKIITPTLQFYSDSPTTLDNLHPASPRQFVAESGYEYPIYYINNVTRECANTCGIGIIRNDYDRSTYSVAGEYRMDKPGTLPDTIEYAITIGDTSLINYPYIERVILDSAAYNNLYPGRATDNTIISNGHLHINETETDYFLYGNKLNNINITMKNMDIVANEMLYRLYYGETQKINLDSIGKKSITEFLKSKTLKSLGSIINHNNDIKPKDIYDLIPYEYDDSASIGDSIRINGNIDIYGMVKVGDNLSVNIGNNVYNISVVSTTDSVNLVINGEKIVLHKLKTVTKGVYVRNLDPLYYGQTVVPPGPAPVANNSTSYSLVGTCETYRPKTWSLFSYYGYAEYEDIARCSSSTRIKVSARRAYEQCIKWKNTPIRGWDGCHVHEGVLTEMLNRYGCCNIIIGGDPENPNHYVAPCTKAGCQRAIAAACAILRNWGSFYASLVGTGQAYGPCPRNCDVCDSRGVLTLAELKASLPLGASIDVSHTADIQPGSRGTYPRSACLGPAQPWGSMPGAISMLTPTLSAGNIDDIAGGFSFRNPDIIGLFNTCSLEGCGPYPCVSIQYRNKTGKQPYLAGVDTGELGGVYVPGSIGPCECLNYGITDCEYPNPPNGCEPCTSIQQKKFKYNFQDGNYQFNNMDVAIYRKFSSSPLKLRRQNRGYQSGGGSYPLDWNFGFGTTAIDTKASDVCGFYSMPSSLTRWQIWESTNTTNNPYKPEKCHSLLVSVSYDNNSINFNAAGKTICFPTRIISCPILSVDLPDSERYYYTNNIHSECSTCNNKERKITLKEQQPKYETIIENKIWIIGTAAVHGDKNFTVIGAGKSCTDCIHCAPGCGGCGDQIWTCAQRAVQCGKSSSDSFPWNYCTTCSLDGSASPSMVKARPGTNDGILYAHGGVVNNCSEFNYPTVSSPQIKSAFLAEWRKTMGLYYKDVMPCNNNQNIDVNNLIEGVMPGSCSLNFRTINYPGLAYRRTSDGSATSAGWSLGVEVAYISYRYKRPKTIQDVLLDNPNCIIYNSLLTSPNPRPLPNTVEKYVMGGDCKKTILCRDDEDDDDENELRTECDKDNACCRGGINRFGGHP